MSGMIGLFTVPGAQALVDDVCRDHGIEPALLNRLLSVEQDFAGMMRRRGILDAIDKALDDVPDGEPCD